MSKLSFQNISLCIFVFEDNLIKLYFESFNQFLFMILHFNVASNNFVKVTVKLKVYFFKVNHFKSADWGFGPVKGTFKRSSCWVPSSLRKMLFVRKFLTIFKLYLFFSILFKRAIGSFYRIKMNWPITFFMIFEYKDSIKKIAQIIIAFLNLLL